MEKDILIVGEGDPADYTDEKLRFGESDRAIVKDIDPNDGSYLRGYNADVVILIADVSQEVRNNVISPMEALGAEVIDL